MKHWRMMKRYLRWRLRAIGRYDVHSPYLYDLYMSIRKGSQRKDLIAAAIKTRQKMLRSTGTVNVHDMGTGNSLYQQHRRVSDIARRYSHRLKYCRMLSGISAFCKPGQIFELGTSLGIGSMFLISGQPGARFVTVEGCPNTARLAQSNFDSAGISATVIIGNFDAEIDRLLADPDTRADLVFFDGNHRKDATIKYFEQFLTRADAYSVFVFDDIHWSEGMEEAWHHIKSHPEVKVSIDLFEAGIVLFSEKLSPAHYVWRY